MAFNKNEYISSYNKEKYKMYQFRVKKDSDIVDILDNMENRNAYILSLIDKDRNVMTLIEIKNIIKPIFLEYGIKDIYLYGKYATGNADGNSAIELLCEDLELSFIDKEELFKKIESALEKNVSIKFVSSIFDVDINEEIKKELIKLC